MTVLEDIGVGGLCAFGRADAYGTSVGNRIDSYCEPASTVMFSLIQMLNSIY